MIAGLCVVLTEKWPSPSVGCVFYGEMAGSSSSPCFEVLMALGCQSCVFSDLTLSEESLGSASLEKGEA